ncbi:unnamed protein product [Prunus brigantina]
MMKIGLEEKARCGLESNSSPPNRPMTIRSEFATNLPITKLAPENSAKKCSHWPENSDADETYLIGEIAGVIGDDRLLNYREGSLEGDPVASLHMHSGTRYAITSRFLLLPLGSGCPIDFLCNSLMMLPNSASPMEAASIACWAL